MRAYDSIEAFIIHTKPEENCVCGRHDWHMQSVPGDPLHFGWWRCTCGYTTVQLPYLDTSDPTIFTQEQAVTFRQLRQAAGVSLVDIAQQTGISVSRLSDFERRRCGPHTDEITKLERCLGYRLSR